MAEEFKRNQIIFSIQQYLNNLLVNPPSNVDVESLDVVLQCLKSSFSVDINEQEHQKLYSINKTLTQVFEDGYFASSAQNANNEPKDEVFEANFKHYLEVLTEKGYFKNVPLGSDEYEARVQKAREKLIENEKVKGAENEKKAEEKKAEGNNYVASRQFEEAIASYTAAINLSPKNPIYYANRAAAYSHLKEHEKAIEDCKLAISVDPKYSKAYSRMGLAHFSLGQYEEAFNAYTKAFELDPSDTIKQSLQIAEKKIKEKMDSNAKIAPKEGNAGAAGAGAGAAGNPLAGLDFSSLLSNPAVQNIIGNLGKNNNNNNDNSNSGEQPQAPPGGLPNLGDLSEMLNNPSVRSAAENVMSNPNFANLLNNPAIMNMASSFLQNPDMLNSVFQNFGLNNNNNNNQ